MGCGASAAPAPVVGGNKDGHSEVATAGGTLLVAPAKVSSDIVVETLEIDASARVWASADEVSRVCRGARNGCVLRKQTVLKADHYPSCHNAELPEKLIGAPNFRQPSELMPVFGTAAPTQEGLRAVCARVAPNAQPIVWLNLRQEPCIYIHGRPFCVKERATPFKAMQNRGVQQADVEQAEVILKAEVLEEARRFGGKLLVLDESAAGAGVLCAQGELYQYWEEGVTDGAVLTPREVFELVRRELVGQLAYHRVPITDEEAPQEGDFDTIVRYMKEAHLSNHETQYVCNCALGRGRTTTGLAIACLMWRGVAVAEGQAVQWDMSGLKMLDGSREPDFTWGEYASVKLLCSIMPGGAERKLFVDCVIDKCSHMQNLRADILPKKTIVDDDKAAPKKREAALATGRKYLERYIYLLLFNSYVCTTLDSKSALYVPPSPSKGQKYACFKEWVENDERLSQQLYPILDGLTLN